MDPTTRELKLMFENLEKRSEEKHKEVLDNLSELKDSINQTNEQVRGTNKNVSTLANKGNTHTTYFKIIWWALGAAWVLLVIGLPLLYNIIVFGLDVRISRAIDSAIKSKASIQINNEN